MKQHDEAAWLPVLDARQPCRQVTSVSAANDFKLNLLCQEREGERAMAGVMSSLPAPVSFPPSPEHHLNRVDCWKVGQEERSEVTGASQDDCRLPQC